MLQQKERRRVLHTSVSDVATVRKAAGAARVGETLQHIRKGGGEVARAHVATVVLQQLLNKGACTTRDCKKCSRCKTPYLLIRIGVARFQPHCLLYNVNRY